MFVSLHTTHVSSVPPRGTRGVASSRDNKIDFLRVKGGPREGVNFACGYYHSDAALDLGSTPPGIFGLLMTRNAKAFHVYKNTSFLIFQFSFLIVNTYFR